MRKFNLQDALNGEPICTRDGYPARIISSNINNKDYPIAVAYRTEQSGQNEYVSTYSIDGYQFKSEGKSPLDLFMASKSYSLWVNIYKTDGEYKRRIDGYYSSEEEAKLYGSKDERYITTIKVNWTEN